MDSTHMAITICNWIHDFAAVHDAYATHAPLVEELLYVTKEVFIDIYNEENFYDQIIDMLISDSSKLTVEKPELGDMNIEEVRESEYFFA
jgi:DNA-directed RNA polymerase